MLFSTKRFLRDEDGAVTVDWIVLTAGLVGLAIVALNTMETATLGLATDGGAAIVNSTTY